MRHTLANPGIVHSDQTSVRILKVSGTLQKRISYSTEWLLSQRSGNKHHIGIQQKPIRIFQVPSLGLAISERILEAQGTIMTKILPCIYLNTSLVSH